MKSEWKVYSVQELIDLDMLEEPMDGNHGGIHPKSSDYVSSGVPFIMANNLSNGKVDYDNCAFISEQQATTLRKGFAHPGDVLLTHKATIGRTAIVGDEYDTIILTPQVTYYRVKHGISNRYLKYYFDSSEFQQTLSNWAGSGSTRAYLGITAQRKLPIVLPPMETQEKIAGLCGALDEKIYLNNAINNNLLKQVLTLYATQFSSLELNGCIGDYCSVKSGFAFKSSWWTNSGIRVIKIGSINQDNLNLLECSYVDEDKADKAKDFVVKAGDLLIAMTGATIGKFAMVPYSSEMLLVNQRVGKFFLGNNPVEKLPFIYCTLKQPEVYGEVVNRGQGSAQPNISASDIMSIPCVIPSQDAINDFNNTSQPLFDLIIRNQRENQNLSELRNALLPKLMSGELDVSDIDL